MSAPLHNIRLGLLPHLLKIIIIGLQLNQGRGHAYVITIRTYTCGSVIPTVLPH